MNVTEAVRARHSCRAFTDKAVPADLVRELLETAARAPSGGNLQPWHVYVLTGEPLERLKADVAGKRANGESEDGEYVIYPPNLWEPLRTRRREAGALRYDALGVGREENGAALLEDLNFAFFGAPVGLFYALDRRVGPPQWSDMGMYMQTLMLLAVERGLATCPQEIWSVWPQTVARHTGMPNNLLLFAGMSLGHEDPASPMNAYRTERAALESFATFLES
ncbi:MAG: nitroreductase [Novosphingobium sp.]|nr:nitroreductase [Novosphingobium sp.]